MKPEDAVSGGFSFILDDKAYFIGLFSINNPSSPGILYPSMLRQDDGVWVEIDKRQPIWGDLQEDITPERMGSLIIKDFNETLEVEGGVAMTWNQKLAAIFRLRMELVEGQVVIK